MNHVASAWFLFYRLRKDLGKAARFIGLVLLNGVCAAHRITSFSLVLGYMCTIQFSSVQFRALTAINLDKLRRVGWMLRVLYVLRKASKLPVEVEVNKT